MSRKIKDLKQKVLVIVGATASGKSSLALQLAGHFSSQIVSSDSRLIYKHMNIGTAKPAKEEMSQILHHMIDLVEPSQSFSLAKFVGMANPIVCEIAEKQSLPIIVGGTGFYLKGLIGDLELDDFEVNPELRESLLVLSTEELLLKLNELDKVKKWKMHINDRYRILRALEIELSSNQQQNNQLNKKDTNASNQSLKEKFEIIWLGLKYESRETLRNKILERTQIMIEIGLIDEVQGLLNAYGELEIFHKTIGYKESIEYLKGQIKSKEELIERIAISTRQYAKRQDTWFRANPQINWLNAESSSSEKLNSVLNLLDGDSGLS